MTKNYRSRSHCLLLYPEDETHMNALNLIKQYYNYAYILHDKDYTDTGEIKKPHYHIVITFNNAKWNTKVAEELKITDNYIEQCRNLELALEYLIHRNEETKYQYPIDEVKGPLKQKLIKYLNQNDLDENDRVYELYKYISESNKIIYYYEFVEYCVKMGMWDIFRRSSLIFIKLIEEHNCLLNNSR